MVSTAKSNGKSTFSGRMEYSGISDVAFRFNILYLKKLMVMKMMMVIIIIMNKLQQTTVFSGLQKLTSAMKLRPEK